MWTFLKAEVTFPILGVDFLRANRLSVSVATNQLVDDSTGDTFRLIEQPSGHTASVMLPANVQKEWDKPARPMAAPPLVGPGATYAAMAARGTVHQAASIVEGNRPSQRRLLRPVLRVADEPQELGVADAGAVEVGAAQLVGRQRDGGFGVGHAQQGLGQAHQGARTGPAAQGPGTGRDGRPLGAVSQIPKFLLELPLLMPRFTFSTVISNRFLLVLLENYILVEWV